jgi:hypothetical protein
VPLFKTDIIAMTWRSTGNRIWRRAFSRTSKRAEIQDIEALNDRVIPRYQSLSLYSLYWNSTDLCRSSNQRLAVFAMAIASSQRPHD